MHSANRYIFIALKMSNIFHQDVTLILSMPKKELIHIEFEGKTYLFLRKISNVIITQSVELLSGST